MTGSPSPGRLGPVPTLLAFGAGGWLYGLVVAWRVDRWGSFPDTLALALLCACFFGLLGLLLWLLRAGVRRLVSSRGQPAGAAPLRAGWWERLLAGVGAFVLVLAVLAALLDLVVTLAFRPEVSRAWLLVRDALGLATGALACWALLRLGVRGNALVSGRVGRRVLVAGAVLLLVIAAVPWRGGDGAGSFAGQVARSRTPPPGLRLVLLGLDGATWTVIDRLVADGELPHLAGLLASGARATVFSPPPHVSPAIWTTIATGQPRTVHGVRQYLLMRMPGVRPFPFAALARDKLLLPFFAVGLVSYLAGVADGVPPGSDMVRVPSLWHRAGAAGLQSVVIGWPCTWPARSLNGLLVSDGLGPGEFDVFLRRPRRLSQAVYPPGKLGWAQSLQVEPDVEKLSVLVQRAGLPAGEVAALKNYRPNRLLPAPALLLERTLAADLGRLNIALAALPRYRPRLLALVLNGADMAMHGFWPQRFPQDFGREQSAHPAWGRLIDAAYRLADDGLQKLLEASGPDTVLVLVSDHGMRPDPHNLIWPGWHDSRAVLLLAGGPLRPGVRLQRVAYLDLAPTILYLLGLEIPAGLPGRVLTEAIEPAYLAAHPVKRRQ